MNKEQLKERLAATESQIEQMVIHVHMLTGRKEEIKHWMALMDKFDEENRTPPSAE